MKKIPLLIIACVITTASLAQQDPLYSQYINNPFVLNPAYAGMTNNLNTSLSYRKQWTGLEGNPTTINANGHISLAGNVMGAGLMIVSDKIGTTTVNEAYGSYAYRIKLDGNKTLSFGLQAGLLNFKTENSGLAVQDANDPLFTGGTNDSKLSLGSGIIVTSDNFFVGLSVPRMLKTKTSFGNADLIAYTQHFYVMGSYIFFISDRIRFRPSVLAKAVGGAPVSFDLNTAFIFHEKYTAGILARNFSTYGIFLQALLKDSFRFGYALEVPTNKSVGVNFSTHEITLGFRLNVFQFHANSGVTSF